MNRGDRVLRISQKINSFQVHNIGPRAEGANKQLEELQSFMSLLEKEHKRQVQLISHQTEQISFENKDKEGKAEQRMKMQAEEIEMMREKIASLLQQNEQSRKESKKKISQIVSSRFEQLRVEMENGFNQWLVDFERYQKQVGGFLKETRETLAEQQIQTKEKGAQLQSGFNEQANGLSEECKKEEQRVFQEQQNIQGALDELQEITKEELERERQEREQNEDLLLSLLENTCEKIQNVIV